MKPNLSPADLDTLRKNKRKLESPEEESYSEILSAVGDASAVLIGEASHGTQDFYQHRVAITKKLIEEKGFNMIVVEGDWTDCYRINRFIRKGKETIDRTPEESLEEFKRFPRWMWRNTVMKDFVDWLRQRNDNLEDRDKVGFYGMDLYNWFGSMEAVLKYLQKVSPPDYQEAQKRYSKFHRFQGKESSYGYATEFGFAESLEKDVVEVLVELEKRGPEYLKGYGGYVDGDELFFTKQNAALVKNAEEYYRSTYMPRANTWNLRDHHMLDTISHLFDFYTSKDIFPKAVIWAHNSHLGDARWTEAGSRRGEWNVGQLVREWMGLRKTFNIGFSTFHGTVTAARKWDDPAQYMQVKNGIFNSFEHVLHTVTEPEGEKDKNFLMLFRSNSPSLQVDPKVVEILSKYRLERFIGVIYAAQTEKQSHYSKSSLSREYDAVLFINQTRALEPLDISKQWKSAKESFSTDEDMFVDPYPELFEEHPDLEERMKAIHHLMAMGENIFVTKRNARRARLVFRKALNYLMNNYANDYHKPGVESTRLDILLKLARCYSIEEDWNQVLDCCNKILSEEKSLPEVYSLMISAFLGKSRVDLAQRSIADLEKLDPRYPQLSELKEKVKKDSLKTIAMFKKGFLLET